MPSAIVAGATGILGRAIVQELSQDQEKWTIHAFSRRQKEEYPSNVKHHFIDLLSSADDMAKQLQNVEADYVFFAAYLQGNSEKENWDLNGDMLENFLTALDKAGISQNVKRIILVLGAKWYGVHLGATKNPMLESDPMLVSEDGNEDRPLNFYYRQQTALAERAAKSNWDWVATYPNDVIGFARDNFMNLGTAIGLYAAINKEMGQPLIWPGSETFYSGFDCLTSSKLHAKFCLWAAREPKAGNQGFNVVNGDTETYQNIWPRVAKRFGVKILANQFQQPAPDPSDMLLANKPPIGDFATELGIENSPKVARSKVESRIVLSNWAQRDDVKEAWERLADREGLDKDALQKATWGFLNFVLGRNYDMIISMSKARKLGWTGYQDTWEAFEDCFNEIAKAKIIPQQRS